MSINIFILSEIFSEFFTVKKRKEDVNAYIKCFSIILCVVCSDLISCVQNK